MILRTVLISVLRILKIWISQRYTIRELLVKETAQILMSLVVGANRTRVLTPYAPPHLYREAVAFAARAITPCNACE